MGIFQNPTVIGILAFIFILGAAVTLHEFGHFIVAKLFKIRVETFSFGFGPRLFGRKIGTTDYRISLVPLGGYVKLGGDESNAPIEGEGASDIPANERFDLRPRWQRILVALAGPVMNILTALTIPFAAGLIYGVPATPAPVVSSVSAGGAAQTAGLQPGDRIISFNGTANPDWDSISGDALLSPNEPLPMVIERNGQRVNLTIKPTPHTEQGETAGFLDFIPDYGDVVVLISDVAPGSPAAVAGLQGGDRVVAIGGQNVKSSEQVVQYIRQHKTEPIVMDVERGGRRLQLTVNIPPGEQVMGVHVGQKLPMQKSGPITAVRYAVDSNLRIMRLTGKAFSQLFTGKRSVRNTVSGPIGIYRVAATSANELGWAGVFTMLGFLSLNLGVFNLLPIPVLDGGAIFLLLIEGILAVVGMKLSMAVRERIQQVGFVVVILLMVFVITNDLLKQASIWRGSSPPAAASPAPTTTTPAK
ncbi:MAG: regulator of sigma protease [Blastocatellia bacterium]|jgi:regulator of sigma E protease|nr:regulator of sigma protease [Blastocatellia bacterium]